MAKGAVAKEEISKKLLEIFPHAFLYNGGKEIRIPWQESDEVVQIKVTLTCAKVNVENESGPELKASPFPDSPSPSAEEVPWETKLAPTQEEKDKVEELCKKLGIIC